MLPHPPQFWVPAVAYQMMPQTQQAQNSDTYWLWVGSGLTIFLIEYYRWQYDRVCCHWVINYIMLLCWIRLVSAQRTTTVSNLVTKERSRVLRIHVTLWLNLILFLS